MAELSPSQRRAVEHVTGPMQVLAGPGSGKTHTIVRRICHLIEQSHIPPSSILVITFTRAAALEMKNRFFSLTDSQYPDVCFGTFHAVFYQILQSSSPDKPKLATLNEKYRYLREIWLETNPNPPDQESLDELLSLISRAKNLSGSIGSGFPGAAEEPPVISSGADDFPLIYDKYTKKLRQERRLDFDDMLLCCRELLKTQENILCYWQSRFRYFLIDEFQDVNALQYETVRLLAAPEDNLFIVGDDDQSIYGFRGADPEIMRRFLRDYPGASQVILETNYRCSGQIVKTSLACIEENSVRFAKPLRAHNPDGEPVSFVPLISAKEEQDYLVQALLGLSERELCRSAVICRTNTAVLGYSRRFAAEKIPFCRKNSDKGMYDHFVARDILAYLRFAESGRREHLYRIMNRPSRFLSRDAAPNPTVTEQEMMAFYHASPRMRQTVGRFFAQCSLLSGLRPYAAVNYVRKGMGYDLYLSEGRGKEEREELFSIADAIKEAARPYAALADWLTAIEDETRLDRDREKTAHSSQGVHLLTLHASKGLEYDNVWIPDLNEGTFPSRKARTSAQIEEERRILYVGMTRAKKYLSLLYLTGTEENPLLPSRFLRPFLH